MAGTSTVTAMIMSTIMTITTTMNRGMITIMLTRTGMLTS